MHQCVFDELTQFVLETISSEEYLTSLGIYRPASVNWDAFKKRIAKQTIQPGIYPRSFGRNQGVHYYGVRNDGGTLVVGNGYPSSAGLGKHSIGLNFQEDHGHGLCQTFALMFYLHQENRLNAGKENYWDNVLGGMKFILDFIEDDKDTRDRCWTVDGIIENIQILCSEERHIKERVNVLKNLKGRQKYVCLSDIVKTILHQKNRDNLVRWFGVK